MIQDEEAAYACCSVGIGRWCWITWASESDARVGAKAVASGYERTADAAVKKAVEAAGPQSKRLPSKWASRYKRGGAARTEAENKPKSRLSRRPSVKPSIPARPTFLYDVSECDQAGSRGEVVIVRHRIVRKTAKKIFVERELFREEERHVHAVPDTPKPRMLAVDRETLRREGRFPHRGACFYASEDDGIRDVQEALTARHRWCATLGVKFPCSAESIRGAYRRLSRQKHPDAGGDTAEFLAVERAYREALDYFASTDDASNREQG